MSFGQNDQSRDDRLWEPALDPRESDDWPYPKDYDPLGFASPPPREKSERRTKRRYDKYEIGYFISMVVLVIVFKAASMWLHSLF